MVADDVIALGYTSRLDEDVKSHDPSGEYAGRSARKSERIGKKYQWIALQRTQARIADRFRFGGDWEIRADTRFDGPWELLRGRDIDPSCLLRRTVGRHHSSSEPCWWAPFANTKFDRVCSDVDWIRDASTVPSRDDLCEVVEPTTGRAWIVGSRWVTIVARKPTGLTSELWHRRSIWYRTAGVFVSANDSAMLIDWLNEKRRELGQNGANLLPQDPYLHPCFLREFPNAPAWEYENRPYFARDPWCVGDGERAPPVAVSLLSDRYFDSGELNCGRDEPLEFHLPSAELAVGLGLRHAEQDGHFENASGRLIAWDPSVTLSGPMAMLLDRDAVVQYAAERDLHIVLFVYGEQRASADVSDHEAYLGQLLFSGAFLHDGAAWSGSIDSRFEPPPNERPSLQGIAMNP